MMNFVDELPEELSNEHIAPYEHYTCGECEGAIKPIVGYTHNMVWQHILDVAHDHLASPVTGTIDMFPPHAIANAVLIGVDIYYEDE